MRQHLSASPTPRRRVAHTPFLTVLPVVPRQAGTYARRTMKRIKAMMARTTRMAIRIPIVV
jgi:hypothetical protein